MQQMEANVGGLREEYASSLRATKTSDTKVIKQRIGRLIDETRSATKEIKAKLDKTQEQTKKRKDSEGYTAEVRIREQQHAMAMRRFVAILRDYQSIQDQFRSDSEARLQRQIKIGKSVSQ